MDHLLQNMELFASVHFHKPLCDLRPDQLHTAVSDAVMAQIAPDWEKSRNAHQNTRRAYYFSAEFLVGRAVYNNLMCLHLTEKIESLLQDKGTDLARLESVEDAALGNGGLGRLAACFLDSAATLDLPLDGYGIRYRYGLFRQSFQDGFQVEEADDWTKHGDPWSVRCEDDAVTVSFGDGAVKAVPYDMPVIGYGTGHISTLRLWQSEPLIPFDFHLFNDQKYEKAVGEKNKAEDISRVLYPNDSSFAGKVLRLKQQYFFCSASLQDIIRSYKQKYGDDFSQFAKNITIQLNDTHPVISIPELIRLLGLEGVEFKAALSIAKEVFCYTNHTVMQEALEKWDVKILRRVCPDALKIIMRIATRFRRELARKNGDESLMILQDGTVHMAYLACYCARYINGVAQIHTEILKDDVLKGFYALYPQKFQNKTNGVTQRRWLALCNPELASLISRLLQSGDWKTDLEKLKALEACQDNKEILDAFMAIKQQNKETLKNYIKLHDGIEIDTATCLDVQIKRLHEYKRQLLNALCVLELYFEIKEGKLQDFYPTTFLFGAKAAPGYFRAKAVIKLINAIADLIGRDPVVSEKLKVVFISNYNVSYAEKIIAAADVSEQISTAGTEASGTGNMKLMLNGAVTLGTYDGANIEIVAEAGLDNNYIFGATVEEIEKLKESYDPVKLYDSDPRIHRVMEALVDGTLNDGGTGMFKELYDAILKGASWHRPDHYYLLQDFDSYLKTRLRLNRDMQDRYGFAKKGWLNMCNAGKFSSDRTIREYAKDIWDIRPVEIE